MTEPRVSYTVREMFQRIEDRLTELAAMLDARVTVEVFKGLGKDVLALDQRLAALEEWRRDNETAALARWRYSTGLWLWVRRAFAFGGWVAAFIVALLDAFGFFR